MQRCIKVFRGDGRSGIPDIVKECRTGIAVIPGGRPAKCDGIRGVCRGNKICDIGWRDIVFHHPESRYAGPPADRTGLFDIFGCEPEGSVIHRVDRHHAVVAPSRRGTCLDPCAGLDLLFIKGHLAQGIIGAAAGIVDRRVLGFVDDAEAQGYIAPAVHGDAAHPAVQLIRCIGPLLVNVPAIAVVVIAHLIPADAGMALPVGIDRMVGHHGLVIAEIPVLQAEHEPVGKGFQQRSAIRLRKAGPQRSIAEE